jgi:virginiamycin B lyase
VTLDNVFLMLPCDLSPDPHGLGIGADGRTIWYTGKESNTIGKLAPDGTLASYALPTPDSFPIYVRLGPDGNMWFTALTGNNVGRITDAGEIQEFKIPTANSRPIAIVPEPGGQAMWFSEEAGNNVARVDMNGNITEFAIPKRQSNVILAGLAFDSDKNLWVQQYVTGDPEGADYIIKVDKKIVSVASPSELTAADFTYFEALSRKTTMHRIIEGPDGNMWFTELKTDRAGRVEN